MERGVRGLVGIAIAAAALVAWTPAAGAAGVADASCDANLGSTIEQPNGDRKVAQTFTALHTGNLDTASTAVTPRDAKTGNWTLEIAATSNGAPVLGPSLAQTIVPNTQDVGVQGTITGTFATPASVTAGTQYALLIGRSGLNGFGVADEGGDPCPGQAYFENSPGGPFLIFNAVDLRFATTVDVPAPAGPGTGSGGTTTKKKCKKKHKKRAASAKKKKCKKKKGKR